jgi:hypothetical protein
MQVWWCIPIIPATWLVEVGGSWFEASLHKVSEHLSQNQTKSKGTGDMAQVLEQGMKPWVQSLV